MDAANIQSQQAYVNMQAENQRWQNEQKQIATQQQNALDDQNRQQATQQLAADNAKKQAAADAAAKQAATEAAAPPGYQWDNTRTDQAKMLASSGYQPGQTATGTLAQKTAQQYAQSGYMGQNNNIIANQGVALGGRKYT